MTGASGRASLGCLVSLLLLLTAALYVGINIGEIYWRFYRYQDAMQQEVRFAQMRTDQAIVRRLTSVADSLGLPGGARSVTVRRDDRARRIDISATYWERVELPGFVRTVQFSPHAEGSY
ncbi:MAG: hypothetical protein ABR499_06805 [Gemmatimonadaceae bacterium]